MHFLVFCKLSIFTVVAVKLDARRKKTTQKSIYFDKVDF